MNISRISVRYAKAFFETALEDKKADIIYKDVRVFLEAVEIADFKLILENPSISPSNKMQIFKDVFKNKVDELSIQFLNLLTKNKREQYLKHISLNFLQLYRKFNGIKHVDITTAFPIDDNLRKEIENIISIKFKTKVELSENVDNSIIGGFIVKVEDNLYDASVTGKLKEVKIELLHA